jgi:hypothetical protein
MDGWMDGWMDGSFMDGHDSKRVDELKNERVDESWRHPASR